MVKFVSLIAFLLVLPSVLPVWGAENPSTILTGKIVTTVTRAVPMPFNCIVDEILVKPGDAVAMNAPLMRYHLQEEAGRLLQREVTTGAATEETRSQMLNMERQLAETIAQRNKAQQLAASGLGSRQASGRLEDDVTSLKQRIALLKTTIEKKERIFDDRLKELESYYGVPVRSGEQLPASLVLTSPITGHVLSLSGTLNPGALLNAGATPIQIGQLDPVLIQVHVYEAEITGISLGDIASVEVPSLNNKKFTARVTEISWVSTDMNVSNPSYYMVELQVPNPDFELKPGFKAVVHFGGKKTGGQPPRQ
ncbi:MAG: efflux RND transporter periplasmic adaptor subunit [Desulfovibrio sp.]|jgi:multidrug efflux pump subunit AcrA (membrane-fusion protein)|nr:efflux RND transporter periplasmic adaptor subunit [Desulfovibrio sp.]